MASLTAKQLRLSLAFAAILYIALVAAIVAWLAFNSEDTVQRRMSATPTATISLNDKETDVPASWQDANKPAPSEAMPQAAEIPPLEADKTVEAVPAEPAVAPKTAEVKPVVKETVPAAATETPAAEPLPPAVTVDTTATPPQQIWQKYARPFDQRDGRPRIGLIIADLGMANASTQTAIQDLPGEVSLAFSSLSPDLEQKVSTARAAGHETILTIPMEPENYPQNDAGPNSLLIGLPDKDNVDRINRAMARAEGYVAITPYMGDKFVTAENKLGPVLQAVKQQQVIILDGTLSKASLIAPLSRYEKIPFARSDIIIDASASSDGIDGQLANLEKLAREKGQAIGVALPYPITFEKLKLWIATLEKKGIVLAPLTALASEEVGASAAAPVAATPEAPLPPQTKTE